MAVQRKVALTEDAARRVAAATLAYERGNRDQPPIRFRSVSEDGGGGGLPIRLAQTSGVWPNEPPYNVKAVQLFVQPANATSPTDWIPETDQYGDPVIAIAINWFSHIPIGQGDIMKWCAIVPISDLQGEYDTGQVTYQDGEEIPIMKPYDKLWLLIAAEC